jgi:hypothetical protein
MITDFLLKHCGPIIAIIGYFNYPKKLRINPIILNNLSIIYNSFLIFFSGYTFTVLSQILYKDGIIFQSNYYFQNLIFQKIIYYFYLSKYLEFFDTFFLYLNGKNPIFLQKFHHIGAVICWHLLYVYKVDAIFIPSFVNSFVHTLMYSYYLGCLLKIKEIRFIKKYITFLQIIQLSVPIFISLYYYRPPIETVFNYNLIIFFVTYVFFLILLFLNFYYKNYIKCNNKLKN